MDRYAVMGNPVAHSLSPRIHSMFAEQTGQDLSYEAILAPIDGFARAIEVFRAAGGKGLNITLPFKREAWERVDQRSARAERAGAVNTIVIRGDGLLAGENTDGIGLLRDLTVNQGITIQRASILMLGAGGAARGVLEPLLAAEPSRLVLANRTAERSRALAEEFAPMGAIRAAGFDELGQERFELIINATSASVVGEMPPLPRGILQPGGSCYDMFYAKEPTAFVRWGLEHRAGKSVDGLGMLVEQAAESFAMWRGVRPRTVQVIAALRASRPS